ncbi:hypothetical protein MK280_06630 [Myxococcota bacterium]|nr:hypothetical protein [Myxococcota bacterium]
MLGSRMREESRPRHPAMVTFAFGHALRSLRAAMTALRSQNDPPENATAEGSPIEATDLQRALQRTHRSVLILLAACAGWILLQGFGPEESPPERGWTTLGVGLGLGCVVLRRLGASPSRSPRTGFFLIIAALVFAATLGLLGSWIAATTGATRTGLLFTLAGLIFSLRPSRPAFRASDA